MNELFKLLDILFEGVFLISFFISIFVSMFIVFDQVVKFFKNINNAEYVYIEIIIIGIVVLNYSLIIRGIEWIIYANFFINLIFYLIFIKCKFQITDPAFSNSYLKSYYFEREKYLKRTVVFYL